VISTDRRRDGDDLDGRLELGPWQGVVIQSR
jgi:hypothetical protein